MVIAKKKVVKKVKKTIETPPESTASSSNAISMGSLLKETTDGKHKDLQIGADIEGRVIQKGQSIIYLDLSPFGTGVIYKSELQTTQTDVKHIKVGDMLTAKIIGTENEDGFIELSIKDIGTKEAWSRLEQYYSDQETVDGKVTSAKKGGLMMLVEGIPGFLPASQLGQENYPRVEDGDENVILQKLKKLEGQLLKVKVLDLDPEDRKLILSEKAVEAKEVKKALDVYKTGTIIKGIVSGVVDFGVFVKFDDSLEGLVHISQLGWKLIEDPREFFSIGQQVEAKIIDIQGTQVSLSIKSLQSNPWEQVIEKYKVGSTYKGKVAKLNPFGAFVYLDKDIHGLAHISQFGTSDAMEKAIKVGEEYMFKITSMKPEEHRMSLKLLSADDMGDKKITKEVKKEIKHDAAEQPTKPEKQSAEAKHE
ncbi:hypothetical protein A3F05_00290 [Candidatus Saccharibacteria bacterium RIFCSPHIGHO2_12_FULL_47_17]|nr:MAG: hypothetical protein A3F05_00290 [Candidatus Saccharibacteria bacterium RIFCSPHIGHO2_12_FULL_47_17]